MLQYIVRCYHKIVDMNDGVGDGVHFGYRFFNRAAGFIVSALLFCLFLCGFPSRAAPVPVEEDVLTQEINQYAEFLFDASSSYTIEDIDTHPGWSALGEHPVSKGLEEGVVWLRFYAVNTAAVPQERVLQFGNAHADRLTVWIRDKKGERRRLDAGQDTELADRPIAHFIPRVPISLDAGEEKYIVLRIEDEGTMSGSLVLSTLSILQNEEISNHWVSGLMFGIFGLVGIYSLALFVRLRQPIFGWLGALAMASLFQWMFFNWGYAGLMVPIENRAWLINRLIIISIAGNAFCSFLFYMEACNLRSRLPRVATFITWFAWFELSNAALVFVLPFILSVQILFFGAFGLLAVALSVLYQAVQGDRMSQRLVIAAFWLMLGYVLVVLTEAGILPFHAFSNHYITLGTLGQWLFLGGAVALHAGQMEEQRLAALQAQIEQERRSNELQDAFGRYVAPDLAEKLLKDPDAMKMGGRLQTITILMSDLRGFTGMTKLLGPPAMCELLNDYLSRMTEVIEKNGGWINEFIGDAILTIFGTPVSGDEDALNACRCAIEMQLALKVLNEELALSGRPTLDMGIGLHTGEAIVGNIGSQRRVKWGVIGDPVNMTARIESLTVGTQVLMSTELLSLVHDKVGVGVRKKVAVKGRSLPLEVVSLHRILGEGLVMPIENDSQRAVHLTGRLRRLQGKIIEDQYFSIDIVQLGYAGLVFQSSSQLDVEQDVVVEIEREDGWTSSIYGKIQREDMQETTALSIIFTSQDSNIQSQLSELLEKSSVLE